MKAFALIGSQNDVGEKAFNDFSDLQAITWSIWKREAMTDEIFENQPNLT